MSYMTSRHIINIIVVAIVCGITWCHASAFPCTCYGFILPGSFEDATDNETLSYLDELNMTAETWELNFGDWAYGNGYGTRKKNSILETIGYIYTQKVDFDPSFTNFGIKTLAINEPYNLDFESLFLHFTQDTTFILDNPEHGSSTSLYGYPWVVGYTNSHYHSGYWLWTSPPWQNSYPWQHWQNNGSVWVMHSEPFTSIELILIVNDSNINTYTNDFMLTIEYPIEINETNNYITKWGSFDISNDETFNLSENGSSLIISWNYNKLWKSGATYNVDTKNGQYFGQTLLIAGADIYVVKLVWYPKYYNQSNNDIYDNIKGPQLIDLRLTKWIEFNEYYNVSINPGWDSNNDLDGDGWVNDTEYENRVNTNCSARFIHESRVIPMGNMWSSSSSWCRINPWLDKDIIGNIWQEYLYSEWNDSGFSGAYNDDMLKLVGSSQFHVIKGGAIAEYTNATIDSDDIIYPYTYNWAYNILDALSNNDKYRIAGNIGATNLFVDSNDPESPWNIFINVLNTILREDYFTVSVGFTGYFGISKAWDTFTFAYQNTQQLIQIQLTSGRNYFYGKTKENYQIDLATSLAIYYLFNVPNNTCINIWGNGFSYGSGNTVKWSNYYKSGVPKNMAYQPTSMLMIDIGIPITDMNDLRMDGVNNNNSFDFIPYQLATDDPVSDYTVIGNSSSTQLYHSELDTDTGYLDIIPSLMYFAWQSDDWVSAASCASDMVIARQYTNGIILYRTNIWGGNSAYMYDTNDEYPYYVNISLNTTYKIVNFDGTLSDPVNNVSIRRYEGVILQTASYSENIPTNNPTNNPTQSPTKNYAPAINIGYTALIIIAILFLLL